VCSIHLTCWRGDLCVGGSAAFVVLCDRGVGMDAYKGVQEGR
jgi:hypothetical protein